MIQVTVSWIKNTWLRRLALVVSLPCILVIVSGQAAIRGLLVMACEPIRRALEVWCVLSEVWPTFREQWAAAPKEKP